MKKTLFIFILSALLFTAACGAAGGQMPDAPEPSATPSHDNTVEKEYPPVSESTAGQSEIKGTVIEISVDGKAFAAVLNDSEAAQAFAELLPLSLDMSELNGNEKYYYLDESLPTDADVPPSIREGDLMLYQNNCLVLFYRDFSTSYSYTPLGRVDNAGGLAEALGGGDVHVVFSKSA